MSAFKFPLVPPRPSVPPAYVAGTVRLQPGRARGLLRLIWEQINRDAPGSSTELRVSADPTNQAPVYIGAFMGNPLEEESIWDDGHSIWDGGASHWDQHTGGPLDASSFGVAITPMGKPRIYRSTYPGGSNGIGNLQVYSQAPAKLHIEVYE